MRSDFNEAFEVVLVEDDDGHATLIRKNLQRAGVLNPFRRFRTGEEALANVRQTGHGKMVVVLDLNLPDIDGFEVLRRLKNDPASRAVPVVVLSTTDDPRDIDRCYTLGCNAFVTKPVGYDTFAEAIRKIGLMLTVVRVPHMRT